MFEEEKENINKVGYNTENISSRIVNEEAQKIAREVEKMDQGVTQTQSTVNNTINRTVTNPINNVGSIGRTNFNSMSQNTQNIQSTPNIQNTQNIQSTPNIQSTQTIQDVQNAQTAQTNQYNDYLRRAQGVSNNQTPNYGFGGNGGNGGNGGFSGGTFDDNLFQMNNQSKVNKKATKKMPIFKKFVLTAAAIALVTVSCFGAKFGYNKYKDLNDKVNALSATKSSSDPVKVTTSSTGQDKGTIKDGGIIMTDVSDVVSDVMPSIVAITSKYIVDNYGMNNFWFGGGGNEKYEQEGAGSGIIVGETDEELLIVTNNHVVEDADSLSVQFIDDKSVEAVVKGTDSDRDLAIVAIPLNKIDADTLSAIKVATLGSSDDMLVGDGVIAIGNALGYGQSVTTGVISAVDREVQFDNGSLKLIQTDAAINGGNSGGALINYKGEVIGINAAKYSSDGYSNSASIEGMGFAIPISSAVDRINELMNKETRTKVDEKDRGYLGISGYDVTEEFSENYGLPVGVLVKNVNEGSAADKAGIQKQDIITEVDGEKVKTIEELQEMLAYYSVNDKIEVTIKYQDGREYKEKKVEVTLGGKETLGSDNTDERSPFNGDDR